MIINQIIINCCEKHWRVNIRVFHAIGELKVYITKYIIPIWLNNIQGDSLSIISLLFFNNVIV